MATVINLTPHDVNLYDKSGENIVETFKSRGIARASQRIEEAGTLDGEYPLVKIIYGAPTDLPEYEKGTYYIVSSLTAEAARCYGRVTIDLLLTAELVRNTEGQVIGCRSFAIV